MQVGLALKADGSGYTWDRPDLPRRGWYCTDVIDNEEATFQCELSSYPAVRYIHVVMHDEVIEPLNVGCVCAGHLEEDYAAAKSRDNAARARSRRRRNWINSKKWRVSQKGNIWQKADGYHTVICSGGYDWSASVNGHWLNGFASVIEAKRAAFNYIYPSKLVRVES